MEHKTKWLDLLNDTITITDEFDENNPCLTGDKHYLSGYMYHIAIVPQKINLLTARSLMNRLRVPSDHVIYGNRNKTCLVCVKDIKGHPAKLYVTTMDVYRSQTKKEIYNAITSE